MSQSESIATAVETAEGLQLKGELVYATVSNVVDGASDLIKNHSSQSIQINCKNVTKIDSAGIALLLEWKRLCKGQQKEYKVVGAKEKAASLISTYKLTGILGLG